MGRARRPGAALGAAGAAFKGNDPEESPRNSTTIGTMRAYDFVHMAMLALGEAIRGKTKLQKTMYFVGLLAGRSAELGYRPHYYGPYSAEVADAVKRLKAVDFITQDTTHFGAVNDAGFEIARHDFRLTDDGRAIAKQKAEADPELWQRI